SRPRALGDGATPWPLREAEKSSRAHSWRHVSIVMIDLPAGAHDAANDVAREAPAGQEPHLLRALAQIAGRSAELAQPQGVGPVEFTGLQTVHRLLHSLGAQPLGL